MATARYKRTVLATCCIPWSDDGTLHEPLFRHIIRHLLGSGLRDLYVFGTAGEGHAIDETTYRRVVDIFSTEMRQASCTAMVGVINLSVPTVLERIAYAVERGVEVFQISLPSWGTVNDTELRNFFRTVCGAFPQQRFLHYNLARSGRIIRPWEYAELAAEHPNLVATKYGAGDPETIAGLHYYAPQLRHFFTELGFFSGCATGECGLLASIAASNPCRANEYFSAAESRDESTLRAFYRELAGMMIAIREAVGRSRLTDGAYDKVVAKVSHSSFPLALLAPYEAASFEGYFAYRRVLKSKFPAWLPSQECDAGNDVSD